MRAGLASVLIAGGWLASIAAQLTGSAGLLHHHALIEGGAPLWLAIPLFLLGWQVMLAAMMLPASLPAIRVAGSPAVGAAGARGPGDSFRASAEAGAWARGRADARFISAFAAVWSVFGVLAFSGDFVLHHVVDATPWLGARPWLVEGGVLIWPASTNGRRSSAAASSSAGIRWSSSRGRGSPAPAQFGSASTTASPASGARGR